MNRKTRKKIALTMLAVLSAYSIAAFLPFSANQVEASGALHVPITVKESSGVASDGFPVTTVVPLPYGQYQDTSAFRLTDAAGATVPAQFEVLNRHWSKDNSIRHVTVHYQPTVGASGSAAYYLKDDGAGSTGGTLTVTETADTIAVDTGPLQFTVDKLNFNLFDTVTYNGQSVIASDAQNGGALVDRFNQIRYDAGMPAPNVTIEESGPLRAVIRVELPAKFRLTGQYANLQPGINDLNVPLEQGDYTHDHGYVVRIYAYSGKSYVKADYSLANSDKTVLAAWPLYFDDFSLNFKMPTAWDNVKIGGESAPYEGTVGNGKYVYAYDDTTNASQPAYVIKDGAGIDLASDTTVGGGYKSPGWIDLSGTNAGMMVAVKNFWQTWPNGLQVDGDKKLSVRLFPKWGQGSYWNDGDYTQTTTGLYWLEDMQHITKSMLFYFHGNASASELNGLSSQFQKEPIGTLPVDWYRTTSVTLDKGGTVPIATKRPSPANTNVDLSSTQVDMTHYYYNLGFNNYLGDISRRAAEATGGIPQSVADFISTENPKYYYTAEAKVLSGTVNTRPQWLSGYDYETGAIFVPSLNKSFHPVTEAPYGSDSWRMRWPISSAGNYKMVAPYVAGSKITGWDARDFAHFWMYENEEFYYYSGDKLLYDWYKFVGEFVKTHILGTENEVYEFANGSIGQTRAIGHMLSALMAAYRVVGDPTFLGSAKIMVNKLADAQYKYGGFDNSNEGWQIGYLAAGLVNFMEEVEGSDEQAYAEAFGIMHGIVEFNQNYSKYGYYLQPDDHGDEAYPNTEGSNGTSVTLVDPEAWWYLHTGDVRVLNSLKAYVASELGNPPYEMYAHWNGHYTGRLLHEALLRPKSDETPPTAVSDLTVTPLGGGQVRLDWTGPADAARYHVRYATRPISGTQTQDDGKINWWKAEPVGNALAGSGAQTLTVSNVPNDAILYFAVRSFDAADNMSEMSNMAHAVVGAGDSAAPAAIANLAASGTTGYSTDLSWTSPGDDGNVGAAMEYDIRYATAPITEANWAQAVPVADAPAPRTAGRTQSFTVTGLSGNTTYYFAMKSTDDASLTSGLSNAVSVTTGAPDSTPPSDTVLTVGRRTSDSIALSWTAPGNDGNVGTAYRYDIRYSTAPITDANWQAAIPAAGAPAPAAAGTAQSMIVRGLSPNTGYYVAMKTLDHAHGASALSNIAIASTTPVNLALNKAGITTSKDVENKPVAVLTDGNVGASGYTRLTGGPQWVKVDLGQTASIASIHLVHRYNSSQKYRDVIVQLSNDPTFAAGVTTVFNNDANNTAGQGIGTDAEYVATSEGKTFTLTQPVTAQYVRVWSNGSNVSTSYSDFIELSVYGTSAVTAPSAPLNVTAAAGNGQVALAWSASSGAASYNVKRSTVNGGPYSTVASGVTGTAYTDATATNGIAYYYVVSAVNSGGESADSAQVSATPSSGAALSRVGWTATASANAYSPANALDGNASTRWATSRSQIPGLYYQVNMGSLQTFNKITVDSGSGNDYPRAYEVYVSADGTNWGSAVATVTGASSMQTVSFPTQTAQYVKLALTGTASPWWSLYELHVFEP